ncbi:MAG: hypothetical protein QNL04_11730 [SAR324 cluster bacterium]|nr:hypothetical protein [SAR324 cluster bacterium]
MLSAPINSFNEDQKNWYFRLLITAILSDGEVNSAEIVYLQEVLTAVKNPVVKKELIQCIEKHQSPELGPAPAFERPVQCAIFIEVVEILICDVHLAAPEKLFIRRIADAFNFGEELKKSLLDWAVDGLGWYHTRSYLIHGMRSKAKPISKIPIEAFNSEQKYHYALILISTVLLDNKVDPWEQRYVHQAISLVDNDAPKDELNSYLITKKPPALPSLAAFNHEWKSMILIEVLLMLSVGEKSLPDKSLFYFHELSEMADYNPEDAEKLIQWNQRGILWRDKKARLIG